MSFDDWYKTNIEPGLLRPPGATQEQFEMLRKAARGSMAACWNAAIDEAQQAYEHQIPPVSFETLLAK